MRTPTPYRKADTPVRSGAALTSLCGQECPRYGTFPWLASFAILLMKFGTNPSEKPAMKAHTIALATSAWVAGSVKAAKS